METFYQQSEIRRCRKPYYVNHTSLSGCSLYLLYHVFDEESKGGNKRLFLEHKPMYYVTSQELTGRKIYEYY